MALKVDYFNGFDVFSGFDEYDVVGDGRVDDAVGLVLDVFYVGPFAEDVFSWHFWQLEVLGCEDFYFACFECDFATFCYRCAIVGEIVVPIGCAGRECDFLWVNADVRYDEYAVDAFAPSDATDRTAVGYVLSSWVAFEDLR